ncbi:hypothetical protein [Cytobacillus sp. IB215665]|uniref:vWA domain-containing protein n=1 Tax=Cytobacillus sp. IB215665 TaxID=3097357 RepID=UPI002A18277E|nr:hypothetical protein [Cytobacillus sp. IB215665]MDX8366635.1 hypothetical protein [Cytobacillus sp. IB215665]
MKPIQFNDKKIDSFLFMELSDLAKALTKNEEVEVEFGFRSYYDIIQQKAYVSHFWDLRERQEMIAGLKSEVYLRCIGNINYTNMLAYKAFVRKIKSANLTSFAKQLFMLLEDIRLEGICIRQRPGTKKAFVKRREVYRKYFEDQLKVNIVKSVYTDALFNAIYLLITSESPLEEIPTINQSVDLIIPFLQRELPKIYEATKTEDTTKICWTIIEVLDEVLTADMLNIYFLLPETVLQEIDNGQTFRDLKRKDKLKNEDMLAKNHDDEDKHEDVLPTWHRETETTTKSFLQFDLEQGTKTDLIGQGVRKGESGDQAMGIVQGSSQQSSQSDFSQMELMEGEHEEKNFGGDSTYGKENRYAVAHQVDILSPSANDISLYKNYKMLVTPYQKKLTQTIKKTVEEKKILPKNDLHFGRLNRKLTKLFTDDRPRMFYKKTNPSTQLDAVFSLLVDCSASMFDKMDHTKSGITLFHETLKSLFIPHQIVGFWEDTADATETNQPNYFQTVIGFQSSLRKTSGFEIMQLQAQEDNRDGFAIRYLTNQLLQRIENQKFLLVFSDGEPAAFGYDQNGIVDTHEAVLHARKNNIEVINIFLANGEISEGQRSTFENIYGKFSIVVENLEELSDVLFPLLKKLLLKTIHTD